MNILSFRTTFGEDVIAEVVDQQQSYYIVLNPIMIMDNNQGAQYISKWVRYSDPDSEIKMFIHALSAVATPTDIARKQYTSIIETYRNYLAEQDSAVEVHEDESGVAIEVDTEGLTDEEAKAKLYANVLQFIKKPEGGQVH